MSVLEIGRKPIILVSPIDTLVTDEGVANLSKGLAPLIRRDLFCVKDLSIVPSFDINAPVRTYFLKRKGLRKQALSHGADIITMGIVRQNEAESTITVEFTAYDVKNDKTILKTKIEDKMSRAFLIEKEIVNQFLEALGIVPSPEEQERIASHSPTEVEAAIAYGRGLKEMERERYPEALIALEESSDFDDAFALALVAKSKVFEQFNSPAKAYQALEVAPRFGKAHLSLGVRLYGVGNRDGAIEHMKMAAELLPVDPMPRFSLGIVYRDSGKPKEARKWFEEALLRNPGLERARVEIMNLPKKQTEGSK
jgi:tetratricopeptide (TPR) repeat protein